ncbi:NTP transferase domain-containing protein [Kineococcus sp. TBRC 1896]|uniref:NTP transferase domain-containing protein n=1 Tax=Kineococcus mangrovi TaxID=1660183 RepID=A0ABV4IAC2_9ACTN
MDEITTGTTTGVAVVVVAGGSGSRFAGPGTGPPAGRLAAKLTAPLGGSTVLGTLLAGLDAWSAPLGAPCPVVLAGPGGVPEEPPGGGPLAGFAAGLDALPAPPPALVVLLGADQPFAASAVPRLLAALAADPALDAVVGLDPDGRRQPLLSAHRLTAARRVLTGLPTVHHRPLRELFRGPVGEVAVSARECLDVDDPADLRRAAAVLARRPEAGPGAAT